MLLIYRPLIVLYDVGIFKHMRQDDSNEVLNKPIEL